jgi:hypothetical protein
MNLSALQHIRKAVQKLNPNHVREMSDKQLNIGLYAASEDDYRKIEGYLLEGLSPARRTAALDNLHRGPDPQKVLQFDLAVYDESVLAPRRALVFHSGEPERLVESIVGNLDDTITLPLARTFRPFRAPYVERAIRTVSRENALFSMATALPDIVPNLIELPWAATEFASDTAILTANQIKMAFLIAAASDREVGYREQKKEIASVIGSAFGWRALARELVGKIPLGAGLIPKAAIAYAATRLIGLSLDRLYRIGYGYTREERKDVYEDALQHGKQVAQSILKKLRPDLAAKHTTDFDTEKEHLRTSG